MYRAISGAHASLSRNRAYSSCENCTSRGRNDGRMLGGGVELDAAVDGAFAGADDDDDGDAAVDHVILAFDSTDTTFEICEPVSSTTARTIRSPPWFSAAGCAGGCCCDCDEAGAAAARSLARAFSRLCCSISSAMREINSLSHGVLASSCATDVTFDRASLDSVD